MLAKNNIYQGDCVELLQQLKPNSVDLVFADPPFNIGYQYDVYDDSKKATEYLDWCKTWIKGIKRCLKNDGTFWLAIGDEFAAELKIAAQSAGFRCRSWVIWYYTFGVNCSKGFSRSHTHLFHFVADPKHFTFNAVNPKIRVPSARQLVYGDQRANPNGRLPDNTWILRPQDAPDSFQPQHDTWFFPRVAGTFKEREGFHGCQMPEQLLGRIIRASSHPGDTVLDPFAGSGTTIAVAKKLGRQWLGFELSKDYATQIKKRMSSTKVDDPLTGPADPIKSAPSTKNGRLRKNKSSNIEIENAVVDCFVRVSNGFSVDHLLCDRQMSKDFIRRMKKLDIDGNEVLWKRTLLKLRKSKKLPRSTQHRQRITFKDMDAYSCASEIAMRLLSIDFGLSLENILCHADFAAEFDRIAGEFSPGFSSFDYRWAALAIRKRAMNARRLGAQKYSSWLQEKLPRKILLEKALTEKYETAGVYIVQSQKNKLYIGESDNIFNRVQSMIDNQHWQELQPDSLVVIPTESREKYALQSVLIGRINPLLNSQLLHPKMLEAAV
ncbi:MAG: DNA methyltransferase [Planctomycetota bacterium]